LEAVNRRPLLLALLRAHRAERLQQLGDGALLAQRGNAHGFERALVGCCVDRAADLAFELFNIGHVSLVERGGCVGPATKRSSPAGRGADAPSRRAGLGKSGCAAQAASAALA